MEIGEILSDAIVYPFRNIKAFILYVILGIIAGIALGGTIGAILLGTVYKNVFAVIGSGIIGIVITLLIAFVIRGYELDVIKYGINREDDAPGIDLVRQFLNGVKMFVVNVVYYIIPIIIGSLLAIIFSQWLSILLTIILLIVFAFAAFMGQCRLAKTEDLLYALSIGEAIGDISKVGFGRLIVFIIAIFVIIFVLSLVVGFIYFKCLCSTLHC